MGCSKEEEDKCFLFEMDFLESELNKPTNLSSSSSSSQPPCSSFHLSLQEILSKSSHGETEVFEKILFYLKESGNKSGKMFNLNKWIIMRLKMDNYEASLCETSWISTSGQPTGVYEYIDVMMNDKDQSLRRLIVDMDFKSQFILARQTQVYSDLINALPSIFVGTEEKLNSIICLICKAAKQCLQEKGLHIPPWRKAGYMQSKWLSHNCKKVPFSPLENHMQGHV
uniref:uncharacterized protein LOC122610560 n=1 Tax=Erigeron canadensis TaxID=72917 RepID=UPI001CB9D5C5|nr:uncharacterized protein LOC122610560 [Erigeron canadensis]